MKFWRNVAIGSTLGFLGVKKYQALKKRQSLRSLLIEETLGTITSTPNFSLLPNYEVSYENSLKPYVLPKEASLLYGFRPYEHFDDTFELVPTNGVQEKVIFYIHGGAYWSQPLLFHYRMLAKIADKTSARIILPVYPKAPAYKAEDSYEMVIDRYLYLVKTKGIDPKNIIMAGDSAGGGFAIGLLNRLKEHDYPMPSKVITFSPWLELTTTNEQIPAVEEVDPLLDRRLGDLGTIFAGTTPVDDPLISPLYGDYTDMPPIYIFTGTHDILYPDIENFYAKAQKEGWAVTLYTYPKMIHVFSVWPTPEAEDSLTKIAQIVQA